MDIESSSKEKIIDESDKTIFSGYVKKVLRFHIYLVLLGIPTSFILYKYRIVDTKNIWSYGLAFILVAGFLLFDVYKKKKDMKGGLKISEEVIVTSSSYSYYVPYFILSNGVKFYTDALKRSALKKKDIGLGTKLIVNYLPKSKFIISMEINGSYVPIIINSNENTEQKCNVPLQSEASLLSIKGRIRRKTYFRRLAISSAVLFIITIIAVRISGIIFIYISIGLAPFYILFVTIQIVKRMHDVNKSGWYFLVPIYGSSLILTEGTIGENKYGEDPKNEERLIL